MDQDAFDFGIICKWIKYYMNASDRKRLFHVGTALLLELSMSICSMVPNRFFGHYQAIVAMNGSKDKYHTDRSVSIALLSKALLAAILL
jgi:hypothetical protein